MTPFYGRNHRHNDSYSFRKQRLANVVLKDTKGNNSGWIVITTAWAFAVLQALPSLAQLPGAHLNPAVTMGLATGFISLGKRSLLI